MNMRKFLKYIGVIQQISNKDKKFGKGYSELFRLNPYNPLSYLTIIIGIVIGLLMFGFVGIKNEINLSNPFKWN